MIKIKTPKYPGGTVIAFSIFYVMLFLFFFVRGATTLDPDFGWHLRVGEDIALEKSLPETERYNYPILGARFIDHEWLVNYIFFKIYSASGYGYLILSAMFSALVVGCFVVLTIIARKWTRSIADSKTFFFWSVLYQVLAAGSLISFFGVRPQVLSWGFFVSLLLIIVTYLQTGRRSLLFLFPFLSFLWANLHGSFLLGIGAFGLFTVYIGARNRFHGKEFLVFLFSLFSGILVTLINPYGIELWKYVLIDFNRSTYYHFYIQEWFPAYMFPFDIVFIIILSTFFILAAFQMEKIRGYKHRYIGALLLLSFLILAIRHVRHIPFFVLASYPILSLFSINLFSGLIKSARIHILAPTLLCLFLFLHSLSMLPQLWENPFLHSSPMSPHKAVEFLKKEYGSDKSLKILNHYNWGGYLDWMWKDRLIFIDGRIPLTLMPNGKTFLEEYGRFSAENDTDVETAIKEYDINTVLWKKPENPHSYLSGINKFVFRYAMNEHDRDDFSAKGNPLLYLESRWEKIFEDEYSVVYRKPTGRN